MKEIHNVIYEADDYRMLDNMSIKEIAEELDYIDDYCIASSSFYGQDDYEGDEWDYDRYKMHKALRLAIKILEKEEKIER